MSAALRRIVEHLESNPQALGEPLYRLPELRMQVRLVLVSPVSVHFAVCEDRPLVFIKGVMLMSP